VKLRPVSAQAVILSKTKGTVFTTRAQDGPGLLTMCVGPAGCGKSEWELAKLRAQADRCAVAGLDTTPGGRTLLLSEMGAETLKPMLLRHGFGQEPTNPWEWVRMRFRAPWGEVVDVLYSSDIYRPEVGPDGELRQVKWPQVVQDVGHLCARPVLGYRRLIIDSLGEFMGSDNNDNMLLTLGRCRLLTHQGVGVHVLHHTPRSDPERPRGGTVIPAKLDIGYAVVGLGAEGMPRTLDDPVRKLKWFKTRFPEHTPGGGLLYVRRVWADPAKPPRYEVLKGSVPVLTAGGDNSPAEEGRPGSGQPEGGEHSPAAQAPAQARQVWAALARRGAGGASTTMLAEDCGIARQRAHDALVWLCAEGSGKLDGTMPAPATGGAAAGRYVAVLAPPEEASA
jgi:hypothetical protein